MSQHDDDNDELNLDNDAEREADQDDDSHLSVDAVTLEYGDIIELVAPRNAEINEQTYYVDYIGDALIKLIHVANLTVYELNLTLTGTIRDESIETILLLSRADERGYARQHDLLPRRWVDIHFSGDMPLILTAEITNLEEDMIELTTYPDLDVIYIDFEYRGLPAKIPIEQIVLRQKPEQLKKVKSVTSLLGEGDDTGEVDDLASMEVTETGEYVISIPESAEPDENIRSTLHDFYLDSGEVVFGEEEETFEQLVEVAERDKKYTIDAQVNNLMDELLSTIPTSQRTKLVMDNIHRIIVRYKELRKEYSKFDAAGMIVQEKIHGPDHKPIVDHLVNMDTKLKWVVPQVKLAKKVYFDELYRGEGAGPDTDADAGPDDAIPIVLGDDLSRQMDIQTYYYENRNVGEVPKYIDAANKMDPFTTPYTKHPDPGHLVAEDVDVKQNLETVVHNFGDYQSTVVKDDQYARRKFVIQRYNLADTILLPEIQKSGKTVYLRKNLGNSESMSIESIITMPKSVMTYSKTELPSTNIAERTSLAANPPLLFRLLNNQVTINEYTVTKFDKEVDHEKLGEKYHMNFLSETMEYGIADTLLTESDKFLKFLKSVIPNTRALIRLVRPYIQNKLNMVDIVRELEPFLVHVNDITYPEYMEIRYFIKERLKEHAKEVAQKAVDFSTIRNTKYNVDIVVSGLERLMKDTENMKTAFVDGYRLDYLKGDKVARRYVESSAILSDVLSQDSGVLLQKLISQDKLSLVLPDNFADSVDLPTIGDMGSVAKIKASDCARRFLTKKYNSLAELQHDNQEEVFYDAEFDDTPYEILAKYKDERKKMSADDFIGFLSESLVVKHEVPPNQSEEMAKTLVSGKKRVEDGEYAILTLKPHLPDAKSGDKLTAAEKREIELEGESRKVVHYYKRVKDYWVRDETVDEDTFVDNNTLFCNMSKICFKNTSNSVCEENDGAADRLKKLAKNKLLGEADDRYKKGLDKINTDYEEQIVYGMRQLMKSKVLKEVQAYRANNFAYELGHFAKSTDEIVESPHFRLRDYILAQDDFAKKQHDLCRFITEYGREPLTEQLAESEFWLYCKDTNVKLLPKSVAELATAFVSDPASYQSVQDTLCRTHGEISDDGDAIVDKYSGYIIRKIDFTTEETYDDQGFRMTSHEIMQKDLKTVIEEALKKKDRVFENDTTQIVYNIFATLTGNLGIPGDGIEELVLRLSIELIETKIKKEAAYQKFSDKMEKDKGKRPLPYKTYRNQTIILIVSSVLLVAIQVTAPSFKPKITAPGCVRSFTGFPLDGGEEDTSGMVYIACVVNKTKSSVAPWDSIQKMPLAVIQRSIKEILGTMLVDRPDVVELYVKKREFLILNPEMAIPADHSIGKWVQFLPPLVPFTVVKSLHNVSAEMKADFLELLRRGNKDQLHTLGIFKTKVIMHAYGVFELINHIVASKDALLKTSANVPFLQNACCNERNTKTTLDYFLEEDAEIGKYLKIIQDLAAIIADTKSATTAPILYHDKPTGFVRPRLPTEPFEQNVYSAFIYYCHFDRSDTAVVPQEFRKLCGERPPGYIRSWSIEEKIEFLKRNGKRFTIENLNQLMEIVYNRNRVEVPGAAPYSGIDALKEFLEFLENKDSEVVDAKLREHLLTVIRAHNPKQFMMEDSEAVSALKAYLYRSNQRMYDEIFAFLDKYGNLKSRTIDKLDEFIRHITTWSMDRAQSESGLRYEEGLYSIVQFVKNSAYYITRVYPEMILSKRTANMGVNVPKHWELSKNHQQDVARFIQKYYEPLLKYNQDTVITQLLVAAQAKLVDLNILLEHIPVYTPIHKGGDSFYLLFDKDTVYMLVKYLWYSVISEYIVMTDDRDLLRADVEQSKRARRARIAAATDFSETVETVRLEEPDEDDLDYEEAVDAFEVDIRIGNTQDLKKRTAELLISFLGIDYENKKYVDLSYKEISAKMSRSRQYEKSLITNFFRDMDAEERRVKNLEKQYKMGRWNVGMQKGLVEYDKATYERERNEIIDRLNNTIDPNDEVILAERDIYELEGEDADEAAAEHDGEGVDISNFGDDYLDGNYYGDEDAGDFRDD